MGFDTQFHKKIFILLCGSCVALIEKNACCSAKHHQFVNFHSVKKIILNVCMMLIVDNALCNINKHHLQLKSPTQTAKV
jgi:hypothetical protein